MIAALGGDDPGSGGCPGVAGGWHTDMRKGFDGLAVLVQEKLKADRIGGQLFVFRGQRGDLMKLLARWSGHVPVCQAIGARAFHLAVDHRRGGDDLARTVGYLLEGIDWRAPHAHISGLSLPDNSVAIDSRQNARARIK